MYILLMTQSLWAVDVCPKNNPGYFCLPPEKILNKEINQQNFYTIPAMIIGLFSTELSDANYPLSLEAKWESPFFGAGVSLFENSFHLMILGGTTRIERMTVDAYAAVVCHEIGHIVGGEPRQTITGAEWSSSEGQADFFAATVCLPRYFKSQKIADNQIAARIDKAGFEMMDAFKAFDTNSSDKTVSRTRAPLPAAKETLINKYPSLQCRYENFRNASKGIKTRPACWYRD
jgi:hypothetical protein